MNEQHDYAKFLAASGQSPIATLHEFRILYYNNVRSLHIFLEGDQDRLYYLPIIRATLPNIDTHCFVCNGKPNISEIRTEIYSSHFDKNRCAFFVDRDFDDLIGRQLSADHRTYITDWHSLENYLVSEEAIEIILIDFAGMSKMDADFSQIKQRFLEEHRAFCKILASFTAWTLAMHKNGKRPNYNNVDISKIICIASDGYVSKRRDAVKAYRRLTGLENESLSFSEMKQWLCTIRSMESKLWVRGKFELWFFRHFLTNYLKHIRNTRSQRSSRRWKVPGPLTNGTLFEALGGRLSRPLSLLAFLEQIGKSASSCDSHSR